MHEKAWLLWIRPVYQWLRKPTVKIELSDKLETISAYLYFWSLALWLTAFILDTTMAASIIDGLPIRVIRYACLLALLSSEVLRSQYTRSGLITACLLVIVLFFVLPGGMARGFIAVIPALAYFLSGNRDGRAIAALICMSLTIVSSSIAVQPTMIDAALFAYSAHNRKFRSIAITAAAITSLAVALTVLLAHAGVIENYLELGRRTRWYLGFRYSLYPSKYLFLITCLVIYISGKRLTPLTAIVLLLINAGCYEFTDSRLSFCLSILVVILSLLARFDFARQCFSFLERILVLIFPISALLSICVILAYSPDSPIMTTLDAFFGFRLSFGHNALVRYGVPLLGQRIEFVGNGLDASGVQDFGRYNYVDCLYVKLLVQYGLLYTIAYLALMTMVCYQAYKNKERHLLIALLAIALSCIVDDLSLSLWYNTFFLLIGQINIRELFDIADGGDE